MMSRFEKIKSSLDLAAKNLADIQNPEEKDKDILRLALLCNLVNAITLARKIEVKDGA